MGLKTFSPQRQTEAQRKNAEVFNSETTWMRFTLIKNIYDQSNLNGKIRKKTLQIFRSKFPTFLIKIEFVFENRNRK